MGRSTTNISRGGVVGIQCGTSSTDDRDDVEVTNINDGGTVGVQGDQVSGVTVRGHGDQGRCSNGRSHCGACANCNAGSEND